ncbi:hypothetical protein LTR70_005135 [Exophiala xenobiotica]|uniref:Uncharacterized protein n=1 Tax=Lithohypha guttulata TaxID=1690604 RepID=A0ABR0KAP8_9EURO|nr:hypothetical protein LTR24_004860 [Lithohypha guttulata]KAK5319233.1 hypothetical protein LTR70_005135 [Exophiala xenobiotica]
MSSAGLSRCDSCSNLTQYQGNTLHGLEKESRMKHRGVRCGRDLTSSRDASEDAKTVYPASAKMEPKPDVHAPDSAADTSNASKAIVQFWVDDDYGRRVRREKIVEQIPRLPDEDRALFLESVYYWWFGARVDKGDLREFTEAFKEIREGERERYRFGTAFQKPHQDISSIQTSVKWKSVAESPRWVAGQQRRIQLRQGRDFDRLLADSFEQYTSGCNPVRATQVQKATQQILEVPNTKQGVPSAGIQIKPRRPKQLYQGVEAATVPPSGRPPVLGLALAPTRQGLRGREPAASLFELRTPSPHERSARRNAIYGAYPNEPTKHKGDFVQPQEAPQHVKKTPCSMAGVKKYAGLPDLDLGTEIYETAVPELTEASTLPTDSAEDSDSDNPNFDKHGLDRDAARARFEPAIVDARNVNFSDTIDGGRRDYRARTRRRRRRMEVSNGQQDEYYDDDYEPETPQQRLTRLMRETAELQAEIERIEKTEKDGSDDEDTVDDQAQANSENQEGLSQGAEDLGTVLEGIAHAVKKKKGPTREQEFIRGLDEDPLGARANVVPLQQEDLPESSISAIAAFSDRLTALETALGVSSLSPSTAATPSILPTLDTLTTQIETLYSTLSPSADPSSSVDPRSLATTTTSTVHLDPLASKIRHLITESKRLEDSRRAATKSFEELLETRDRHAHLIHSHSAVHAGTEARLTWNLSSQEINGRPASGLGQNEQNLTSKEDLQQQFTSLFLDDQASRITALYNLLPTLQSLQPLLPVVLERLRALSVIHAGAAEVRTELDDFESRFSAQEKDIKKWREAVESAENAMAEGREVMKENVATVGDAVRGLERRMREVRDGK